METSVWLWVPSIEKGLGSITGDKVRNLLATDLIYVNIVKKIIIQMNNYFFLLTSDMRRMLFSVKCNVRHHMSYVKHNS